MSESYSCQDAQHDSTTSKNTNSAEKMSSISHRQPQKSPRVLACVLCQQRKKKCDRKTPCSNCAKLHTNCIPSTPAPPRKRRRANQELLDRLARCEELLRHCKCLHMPMFDASSPDVHDDHGAKTESSPGTDGGSAS